MDLFNRLRIKDVMVKPVYTIFDEEDLLAAHEKFVAHSVSYLCVLDHSERLVGLISRKYLYKTKSPMKISDGQNIYDKNIVIDGDSYFDRDMLSGFHIRSIMHQNPPTIGPEALVSEAIISMAKKRIGCIPVVNNDRKVLGIMTNQDIVNITADILQQK